MNGREWPSPSESLAVSGPSSSSASGVVINVNTPVVVATKMLSTCEMDHMYASVNDKSDFEQLRLFCLEELDLIQYQADQLAHKDKVIAELKRQIEALRMRYERITRRVTLQQRHEDNHCPNTNPTNSSLVPVPGSTTNVIAHGEGSPSATAYTVTAVEGTNEGSLRATYSPSSNNSVLAVMPSQPQSSGSPRKRRSSASTAQLAALRKRRATSSGSKISEVERRPLLTTSQPYYTIIGEPDFSCTPVELRVPLENPPIKEEESVQVPSWRERHYTPLYVIEGTENLEDDVFLKRHHKLECDERRRKRWDIQRIREQTLCERLKQRVEKASISKSQKAATKEGPPSTVRSFFGSAEDIHDISIDAKLPVVAFGMPLRLFEPISDYVIPWNFEKCSNT